MFNPTSFATGVKGIRYCYSDCAAFSCDWRASVGGLIACDTWSGCIDAPDYYPQGSVRVHNTIKHCPQLSVANRDKIAGHAHPGVGSDDDSPPVIWEGFAA